MREHIEHLIAKISKVMVLVGVLNLCAIVVMILINVVARSFFNSPILWSMEMTMIFVVWFTYILFGVDYYEDRHFSIDVITLFLSERGKAVLNLIINIISLTGLLFLGYSCIEVVKVNGGMTLTATPITLFYAFFLPLGLGITTYLIFVVLKIVEFFLYGTGTSEDKESRE